MTPKRAMAFVAIQASVITQKWDLKSCHYNKPTKCTVTSLNHSHCISFLSVSASPEYLKLHYINPKKVQSDKCKSQVGPQKSI